jgi:hypothetical protein
MFSSDFSIHGGAGKRENGNNDQEAHANVTGLNFSLQLLPTHG